MTIAERFRALQREVANEVTACGRTGNVTIVAVTKKQPVQAIVEAIDAGVTDIGENYVQEAQKKFDALQVPVRKHFIGHIQTNKARTIVQMSDLVQSVDSFEAAEALARGAQILGKRLPVLIQVNVSGTERFGIAPEKADFLADQLLSLGSLRLDGVMAIGPLTSERADIQRAFELAAKTFDRIGGSTLSIGMSGDWREAIAAGSTMIRIGTTIFGPRGGNS